jgi:hypothetical protein
VQGLHRARGVASSAVCLAAALMEVMALRAARAGGCCPTGMQIVSMQSNPYAPLRAVSPLPCMLML